MKRKVWLFGGLILLGGAIAIALPQLPAGWLKPDYLVHISSVLTLISFSVRSMLALRLLAIGAQATFIPYCFFQSPPLWPSIAWNVLFMGVNVINVIVLLLERRPVVLNPDEQRLYDLAFKELTPREFLKLATLGEWYDGQIGEELTPQGEVSPYLAVLSRGQAAAFVADRELTTIPEGKLLGIPSALEGEPSIVGVRLVSPSRYLRWSVVSLRQFTDKKPEIREKLRLIVSHELVKTIRDIEEIEIKKWQRQNKQAMESIQEEAEQAVDRMQLAAPAEIADDSDSSEGGDG